MEGEPTLERLLPPVAVNIARGDLAEGENGTFPPEDLGVKLRFITSVVKKGPYQKRSRQSKKAQDWQNK